MLLLHNCPQCDSKRLQRMKDYTFTPPQDIKEEDIAQATVQYEIERLWIFFNHMIKTSEPTTIGIDYCPECGLLISNPRCTDEEMTGLYETATRLDICTKRQRQFPTLRIEERSQRVYSLIARLGRQLRQASVLDYGGMQGYNLMAFARNGCRCFVLDYMKDVEHPENVSYLGRDLDDLSNEKFDVVILSHVLEHVDRPSDLVRRISQHLTEDGLVYAEAPLGCRHEWKYLSEPATHINFFSEQSLYNCCTLAGLHPCYLATHRQWITRGYATCVNLIAAKRNLGKTVRYKSTLEQVDQFSRFKKLWRQQPLKKTLLAAKRFLKGQIELLKDEHLQ